MSDLIAAISTPLSPSAIGILRLSGPGAAAAADRVFRARSGRPLAEAPSRTLVYGSLLDREGRVVDQVLATVSRAPHSYTGEDTAELQCHGSPMVLSLGLEALCAAGARLAQPGEFTEGLPGQQAGPPPGRGGGRPAGGRDAGGRPRGGGTALRGPVPAGGGGLPRSGGPAGTFPRRIGLSRGTSALWRQSRSAAYSPAAAGRLAPAGNQRGRFLVRGALRHLWAFPTRASPLLNALVGYQRPSSPISRAPPGTRWRSGACWAAYCGSSMRRPPGDRRPVERLGVAAAALRAEAELAWC